MYNTRLTLKVLSVDWDYFVNAEMDQRVKYFPDGGSEDIPIDIEALKKEIDSQEVRFRQLTSEIQKLDLTTEI